MKKIAILLSLLILISTALWANGGAEILPNLGLRRIEESTIDRIGDDGSLNLSAVSAEVQIFRDNSSDTVSAVLTGQASHPIDLKSSGNRSALTIETDWNKKKWITTKDLQLEIHLPRSFSGDIKVRAVSGSITFPAGNLKAIDAASTSGKIYLSDITAEEITLKAVSGDIEAFEIFAERLGIYTTSGDINVIAKIKKDLIAASVSGNIEMEGTAELFHARSTSGEITLEVLEASEAINTSSISGDIEITIPADMDVKGSAKSVSGDKNITLPLAQISGGSKTLEFSVPGAAITLTAHTISGDINIQESR